MTLNPEAKLRELMTIVRRDVTDCIKEEDCKRRCLETIAMVSSRKDIEAVCLHEAGHFGESVKLGLMVGFKEGDIGYHAPCVVYCPEKMGPNKFEPNPGSIYTPFKAQEISWTLPVLQQAARVAVAGGVYAHVLASRPIDEGTSGDWDLYIAFASRRIVQIRPRTVRRRRITSRTRVAHVKLQNRVNLPNRGTPATCTRAMKTAVVRRVEVVIIHHQLADHLHLLPLQRIHFLEAPVCMPRRSRIGSHLRHHAGLLHRRGVVQNRLRPGLPNLIRECLVEPQTNVKVKRIGSQQPAIASLAIGRITRPCIFREVKVSNHRVDVSFALVGELLRKRSMVRGGQSSSGVPRKLRKLRFLVGKVAAC